ncbi:pyruvate carboxylase [Pneumocystis carinii B80]|uniref:Pyruvate carboxylase n=1 Tax=Pneumocystis carinii (strain B80) TaxID=1408658 RepID=A0A0W4ZSS0_PNEC8|nr:pyruvate carboxylase [Pneumocystis carinii B80]KTW31410.1 pyruvate carboxylase [Pneumocystis carinii B80]
MSIDKNIIYNRYFDSNKAIKNNGMNVEDKLKLLVANRSEIATRIFRTAQEFSISTLAIYSYEDRFSIHRQKADESCMIGKIGQYTPVSAYLAIDEIIEISKKKGVHMIHPGYGFLSENSEFARKVEEAGIIFIGPTSQVINVLGDKIAARKIAMEHNIPVIPGTDNPISTVKEALEFTKEYGFPILIKAACGGGGRGMRVLYNEELFEDYISRAISEAESAFGNGSIFIEKYLDKAKHIEVQILADNAGNVVHLYERDCSVQRRYQKIVEVAPAKDLDENVRNAIFNDAIKLAKAINYTNAGTVEFLIDSQGKHYFIEVNTRIQVEHTITEEIIGIDIVSAQIQIALGATLPQIGLFQDSIYPRGYSIQCRITAEDPESDFRPEIGKIEVYHHPGGNGVRLDEGNVFAGALVSPYYDSLLLKCLCNGRTYEIARRKMLQALSEFRIYGIKTNIPFLVRLLNDDVFILGKCWTTFINDTLLFPISSAENKIQNLLLYIGDVIVNERYIEGQNGEPKLKDEIIFPKLKNLENSNEILDVTKPCSEGWRKIIIEEGPEEFSRKVRAYPGCLVTDTTWRDAHQSLLATRIRTIDILNIAPHTSYALKNAFSLECWGGATFDVALRFLHENPWDRLRKLRKLVPNIPFQMLLRGSNGLGYSNLPDNAIYFFCKQAKENGIDIFRIFDALNNLENIALGIDAVRKAGGVIEAAICYTGDILNIKKKYDYNYYMSLVDKIVSMGIHILAIKDMAGLLKPQSARLLVRSIRKKYPDLPIHIHTHDTAGTGVVSMLACAEEGADVVDLCSNSMSGMTSQPSISAYLASVENTPYETGLSAQHVRDIDLYWAQIRLLYFPFDIDLKGPETDIYEHEIPGGQLSNLKFQTTKLNLVSQWEATKKSYIEANFLLGDIIKVTPTSKVVGDLALFMVQNKLTYSDVIEKAEELNFPESVLDFFQGLMGEPYGGFPEPLRTNVLKNKRERIFGRAGKLIKPIDFTKLRSELISKYGTIDDTDIATYIQFPKVYDEYKKFVKKYGDISIIPTYYVMAKPEFGKEFQIEVEGQTHIIKLLALGPVLKESGSCDVFFELNGQIYPIKITDKKSASKSNSFQKADLSKQGEIAAPMSGIVLEIRVQCNSLVKKGDVIAVLSAMKMEIIISSPIPGRVDKITVHQGDIISAGDLIATITNH